MSQMLLSFRVPRDISPDSKGYPKMAAFTTNVEFGTWADSGKNCLRSPTQSRQDTYLQHYAEEYKVPCSTTLVATLDDALEMLEDGAEREGGERFVPLFSLETALFSSLVSSSNQSWQSSRRGSLTLYFPS